MDRPSDIGAAHHGTFCVLAAGSGSRRVALFWGVVWCCAAVAIAWPDLTTSIASTLGLRRGADLVMYFAILFSFVGFYMIYVRMRRLDANLTLLVRKLAIENPVPTGDMPKRDDNEGTA